MFGAPDRRRLILFGGSAAPRYPEHLRRRRRRRRRGGRNGAVGFIVAVTADSEQALLQVAVGGERARFHHAVHPAVDHDRDAVGDGGRDGDVLLDHQHGKVFLVGEPDEKIAHLSDDHGRKALGRLVHDEEARIAEQRPPDRQHLLLAARQLPAAVVAPFRKAREDRIDAIDGPRSVALRAQSQSLLDRQARPESPPLRHVAQARASDGVRIEAHDVASVEADRPRAHRREPDDGVAERRLAHAVAADDRKHAMLERQRDALQSMRLAVIDLQILHLQDRLRLRGVSAARPIHAQFQGRWPEPRRRPRCRAARPP